MPINAKTINCCTTCSSISATIGEKSKPFIGGITLLNKFKYTSEISLIVLQGWSSHRILGIHVKNILNISIKKYKLNTLFTAFANDCPIISPYA